MELEEIKEFLRQKKGYLKEGGKRLRKVLNNKGFITTIATCKEAIKQINQELKQYPFIPSEGIKEAKILFYDIEVSYGLARVWRPGYKLKVGYDDFVKHPAIICISYKWNNSDEIYTVRWSKDQNDKSLLELFIKELNKADFIVAHNGDTFDLPWIKTRALYHEIDIYPKYTSVDTLKLARYQYRFPSNRLDDLGDYLGLGRKIKTDRELWTDVVDKNNQEALDRMITYCERDVTLLEDVYNKLTTQSLPGVHAGVLLGKTKQTSPYTGGINIELVRTSTTKAGTVKRLMKDLDTNKYFEMSNRDYMKFLEINK